MYVEVRSNDGCVNRSNAIASQLETLGATVSTIYICTPTVEPLNNGHIWDECFVHCSEVVPSSEVYRNVRTLYRQGVNSLAIVGHSLYSTVFLLHVYWCHVAVARCVQGSLKT